MRQMVKGNGIRPGETKQQRSRETKHKKSKRKRQGVVRPGESHCKQHVAITEASNAAKEAKREQADKCKEGSSLREEKQSTAVLYIVMRKRDDS